MDLLEYTEFTRIIEDIENSKGKNTTVLPEIPKGT